MVNTFFFIHLSDLEQPQAVSGVKINGNSRYVGTYLIVARGHTVHHCISSFLSSPLPVTLLKLMT